MADSGNQEGGKVEDKTEEQTTEEQSTESKSEEKTETQQNDKNAAEEKGEKEAAEEQTPPPKDMKAIVLTGFGGLKTVKIMKKPEPTAGEGEVLIRVKACGLNFLDVMIRQGAVDNLPKTPVIMGLECAGEIEAVGEGVTEFQVGDRVGALTEYKSWAALTAVSTKFVYKLPEDMSFQDAAATMMNYTVAYALLFDVGFLKEGQTVLVHSAGGGVGQAISQLSRMVPNVTLVGTASSHKHEKIKDTYDHLEDHGDYSQIKKIAPGGFDLVLDCLCGDDANKGYHLLKPMGRHILYGSANIVTGETKSIFSAAKSWWQVDKISPLKLFDENKSISGFHLRHLLYRHSGHEYVRGVIEKVFALWKEGKIKPTIDSTWAFEDIPEAMQKLHDRKNIGKIVLDPSMEPKPKPQTKTGKKEDKDKDKEKDKDKDKDKDSKSTPQSGDGAGDDTATSQPENEAAPAEEATEKQSEESSAPASS